MRILIVEDEATSRFLLSEFLASYGTCHVAVDGKEGINAVREALDKNEAYDLICLDIRMPKKDGHQALRELRRLESAKGVSMGNGAKVIVTTVFSDSQNILQTFNAQCEAYLIKPITKQKLLDQMKKLGLATE